MRELSALPAQATAFFIHTAAADPQFQNTQLSLSLGETCTAEQLRRAWQQAASAHTMLRSAFRKAPTGELLRRELDAAEASWRMLDWSSVPPTELSAQWAKIQAEDATEGVDLVTAPLVRFTAITLPGGHCHLLATFPKLLLDEDSLFHLICEWLEALEGRPLPEVPLEEGEPTSSATPAVADWWGQFFNNAPEPALVRVLPVPEAAPTAARHQVPFLMDRETSKSIAALAQKLSVSAGDVFLAAWSVAVARLSARNRVLMLAPARCAEPGPAECGLHDNLLPFQATITGSQTAEAFIREVARTEKDRAHNSAIPLERVLLLSQPQKRLRDFSTAFRWLPPSINDRVHDVFPRWINLDAQLHQQSYFPLAFEVRDGSRYALTLNYSDALPTTEAERLLTRIRGVLDFFLETPNKRLSDIRLLDEDEWQTYKDGEAPKKGDAVAALSEQIATAVVLHADGLAVDGATSGSLTYGELDSLASSLAAWLRQENLADGWTIGVCLTPTSWLPVAVLGVLRAGDTCLPLDAGAERAWLLQKVEGCDVELIICDSQTAPLFEGKRVVVLDQQWETVAAAPAAKAEVKLPKASFFVTASEPADSSSIIALSPEVTAEACEGFKKLLSLGAADRVPLTAAAGSGAFVETLLGTLSAGATLVLAQGDELPTNATHLRLTAAQFRRWVVQLPKQARELAAPVAAEPVEGEEAPAPTEPQNLFENLQTVCVEAASLPPTVHATWQSLNEGQSRWIQYASPLGLCGLSVRYVQQEGARSLPDPANIPLGTPAAGVRAELHDFVGHPLPARYEGVLEISADGRKLSVPAWRDAAGRFYLAPTPQSLLEAAFSSAPGVLDVHTAKVEVEGHPTLGAWIIFEEGTEGLPADFAAQVHGRFPDLEYPGFIKAVAEFPLTHAGQIDVASLPKPEPIPVPVSSMEATAAVPVPVARVVPETPAQEWQPLHLLQKTADAPTLFLIHDLDGNPDRVKTLAGLLAEDWTTYATSARGLRTPSACHNSIEAEAAALVEAICLLDPEGPYHLFGWDYGAVLALEMARQLRVAGRQVPYLALAGAKAPQMPEAPGGWKKSLTKLFQGNKPTPITAASTPVAQAHARALQEYRARALEGPAGIILGADQVKEETEWMLIVPEATTEKMSCQSRDMLNEPSVKRLAVILRNWTAGEDEEEDAAE